MFMYLYDVNNWLVYRHVEVYIYYIHYSCNHDIEMHLKFYFGSNSSLSITFCTFTSAIASMTVTRAMTFFAFLFVCTTMLYYSFTVTFNACSFTIAFIAITKAITFSALIIAFNINFNRVIFLMWKY